MSELKSSEMSKCQIIIKILLFMYTVSLRMILKKEFQDHPELTSRFDSERKNALHLSKRTSFITITVANPLGLQATIVTKSRTD